MEPGIEATACACELLYVYVVNILTYVPISRYIRRNYPIIPTGVRYNIKGRWQPGHQWDSFDWFIICTVLTA